MLLLFAQNLWAQDQVSCNELTKDLLAIEYEIQNAELKNCEPNAPAEAYCKKAGKAPQNDPRYRKYEQVVQDLNKAMAELVIQQGIEAIGKNIEGGNNALNQLDDQTIKDAESYMEILEKNLEKSKLLTTAMKEVKEGVLKKVGDQNEVENVTTSFWSKHDFTSENSLEEFKTKLQKACFDEVDMVNEDPLCTYITKEYKSLEKLDKDLLKTLHGYSIAEIQDRPMPQSDPTEYYKMQRQKFLINNGSKSMTAEEFEKSYFSDTGAHTKLKKALEAFKKNKNKKRTKAVYAAAKDLDPIEVNYDYNNAEIGPEENDGDNKKTQEFYEEFISGPLNSLNVDLTDRIYTDMWKCNSKNLSKKSANQVKLAESSLNTGAKDLLVAAHVTCEVDATTGKKNYVKCLNKACGFDKPNPPAACENKKIDSVDIKTLARLTNLNKLKKFNDIFNNPKTGVMACYDKTHLEDKKLCLSSLKTNIACDTRNSKTKEQKDQINCSEVIKSCSSKSTLEEKINCLDAKRAELGGSSTIKDLKDKVLLAQQHLIKYDSAQPFKDLKAKKHLALMALEKSPKSCLVAENFRQTVVCNPSLSGIPSEELLKLAGPLGQVELMLDKSMYTRSGSAISITAEDEDEFDQLRENYIDECDHQTNAICRYYQAEENARLEEIRRQRRVLEDAKIKRTKLVYEKKQKRKSAWGSFGKGFMQGTIVSTPHLVTAWAQYDNTKNWRDMQIANIQRMEKDYERRMDYYQWAKDNGYLNAGYYNSNWGQGYYNTGYDYYGSFQSDTAVNLYNNTSNPFTFSFSSPPVISTGINTYGTSIPSTTINSGIQPVGFSF